MLVAVRLVRTGSNSASMQPTRALPKWRALPRSCSTTRRTQTAYLSRQTSVGSSSACVPTANSSTARHVWTQRASNGSTQHSPSCTSKTQRRATRSGRNFQPNRRQHAAPPMQWRRRPNPMSAMASSATLQHQLRQHAGGYPIARASSTWCQTSTPPLWQRATAPSLSKSCRPCAQR